ncbi:Membrane attack complex component/perforin (MACPF) domain [Fusarium oxysporum f. sp. vasinfectum]|nr:Membrane attack complex component/perforin (MACPF) domain [Fusarium oxysporum f. sp. vasinfectum]
MDEADWDSVLRNCCLLYGWKIDKRTSRIVRATTPAFRLRNKLPPRSIALSSPAIQQPVITPETPTETSVTSTSGTEKSPYTSKDVSAEGQGTEAAVKTEKPPISENVEAAVEIEKPLTAEDVEAPIPAKFGAIPSYAINDRSRIEITMARNEFQESMARHHFGASSVEGSASGGWGGYSVGVTGGAAKEDTSGGNKTKKSYTKRMIGSYMFPRVDVFLRPEDLEPTEELRAALDGIKQTKNINALRELYSTFGHLFCHSVTLGGCLQTTKIVESDEDVKQSKEKQSFKAEVGVAVSTPFGAKGNAKGSKESQDSAEAFNRSASTSESMGFEATGGNSILAADPPAWSGSVANFNNWRIIEQTELTPIFFDAVPKLSEYMVIPESRILHVRFKVASQNESFGVISHKKVPAYLGHRPNESVTPVRTNLRVPDRQPKEAFRNGSFGLIGDMTKITTQNPGFSTTPLFEPSRTQAPILMFPSGAELGTKTDEAFSHVVWRLEIARGHSIGPDTLLCVKSAAMPKADLALTVYRNAQGVFLPSISSTDEPCYWRLEPVETSGISKMKGDRYKFGDSFRLTWSFSDQTNGFRDFVDDSYGRRNLTRPSEIKSDKLCFKVPFPRFEGMLSDYMAVLMSTALTTDPIIEKIKVLDGYNQEKPYNLHDMSFRVDLVGNDGNGDKNDYANLTATSWQELDQKLLPGEKLLGNMLGPSPMLINGVLGDMEFTRW